MSFRIVEVNTAACEWDGAATFTCRRVIAPFTVEVRFQPAAGREARLRLDGVELWRGDEPGERSVVPSEVTAGRHRLAFTLADGGTITWERAFRIDVAEPRTDAELPPPVVGFATPPAGAVVSGDLTVEVRAYNPYRTTRDVYGVDLFVDGRLLASLSSPPWTRTFDTRLLSPGEHRLLARAHGPAGTSADAEIGIEAMASRELFPEAKHALRVMSAGTKSAREEVTLELPANARRVDFLADLSVLTGPGGSATGALVDAHGGRLALFSLGSSVDPPVPVARDLSAYRGQPLRLVLETQGPCEADLRHLSVTAYE